MSDARFVRLDDRSVQGEVLKNIMRDLNAAHESGDMRAIITMYMDKNGDWNWSVSTLPSYTRAIGALEQMKFNLMGI